MIVQAYINREISHMKASPAIKGTKKEKEEQQDHIMTLHSGRTALAMATLSIYGTGYKLVMSNKPKEWTVSLLRSGPNVRAIDYSMIKWKRCVTWKASGGL